MKDNHVSDRHVSDRLGDHLEGDLSLAERSRIGAHLARCEACASELRELRATVALLRGLPDPEPPARLTAEILRRIEAGEGRDPRVVEMFRRASEPRFAVALAAGIAGLLLFTSLEFGTGDLLGPRPDPTLDRFAARSDPGGVAEARAMRARRPLSLHRAPAARWVPAPRRPVQTVVAFESVTPPQLSESASPSARLGFFGGSDPEVPLRDLDGELDGLMRDPIAFLERIRRTEVEARRPMIAPLVEHSARRGDVAEVARHLGAAVRPVAAPAPAPTR